MHVVIVAKYPLPGTAPKGGVERVVEACRSAIAQRARVTLLTWNSPVHMRHEDEFGPIVYLKKGWLPSSIGYWTVASIALYRWIRANRPDVVHVHDMSGVAFCWPRSKPAGSPQFVFTPHGLLGKDIMARPIQGRLTRALRRLRAGIIEIIEYVGRRKFSKFIVISNYILDEMSDVRRSRWQAIPNPVNAAFTVPSREQRADRSSRDLLMVGVVDSRKNVLEAIRMMRVLHATDKDVHLHVVGPIAERGYLETCLDAARAWGIDGAVTFHGAAGPEKVVDWMDRADVLLLTSKQETAPVVVAEAHCRGLPTIVPRKFGLLWMVDEGVNGLFWTGDSPEMQAARVREMLSLAVDREAIRRRAIAQYDVGTVADRTLAFYAQA